MGLNEIYDGTRRNLIMMKHIPTISQAYAMLLQEKKQTEIHTHVQFVPESASMTASYSGTQRYGHKFTPKK